MRNRQQQMPHVNLARLRAALSNADYDLVRRIVATRGPNKGRLRASKPKVTRTERPYRPDEDNPYGYPTKTVTDPTEGCASYLWRMVAFFTSPKRQHHCMPVCAEFDLPERTSDLARKTLLGHLDALVNVIVDGVPKTQWHGVRRWGQAYGMVGTPQVSTDDPGAIIYR